MVRRERGQETTPEEEARFFKERPAGIDLTFRNLRIGRQLYLKVAHVPAAYVRFEEFPFDWEALFRIAEKIQPKRRLLTGEGVW
jgi:hypothetical protein